MHKYLSENATPLYQVINGFNFPPEGNYWSKKTIESALKYEARDDDKFIVTYPKNGTTWAQQIVYLIINDGVPQASGVDQLFCTAPFLEMEGVEGMCALSPPRVAKTHLPFNLQPYNPKAKYLWVLRNPKDACVSFYKHVFKSKEFQGTFHEYFKHWIAGQVAWGDYFDHVLSWWQHRNDANVTFLIYEHMKKNPTEGVLKVARFLGEEYVHKLEQNKNLAQLIVERSSVNFMKEELKIELFVRKGEVGDWRNHFTKEESDLVDERLIKKFTGTGLEMIWKEELKWI